MHTGSIPVELGALQALQELLLADNGLTGTAPTSCAVRNKQHHKNDHHSCILSCVVGPIPSALSQLAALRTLQLRNNSLTGSWLSMHSVRQMLRAFDARMHLVPGPIPPGLRKLVQAEL